MLDLIKVADVAPASGSLRDRVVLVAGATGGLGRATALACAQAGAMVILLGRKVRALEVVYDEIESLGGQPALYPMDLEGATPADYAQLAEVVEREYGRLDGIVHAAARFDGLQPFDQQTPTEFQRTQQVNLVAPFLLTQACIPLLREAPDSAVVFVFDDAARMGNAFWGGYGVAKQGLTALASIIHEETEQSNVRTHALLPAPMRTELRRMAYFGEDSLRNPIPAQTADAVAWLLGPAAMPARGKVLDLRLP